MEKVKEYKGIIILILVVLVGVFYWFEIRSSAIKKSCYNEAQVKAIDKQNRQDMIDEISPKGGFVEGDYNSYYKWCLQSKGL